MRVKLLHKIGLSNLSDDQVCQYYKLKKLGLPALKLFHAIGLTNLSDKQLNRYYSAIKK
jgi:hypothetical protein